MIWFLNWLLQLKGARRGHLLFKYSSLVWFETEIHQVSYSGSRHHALDHEAPREAWWSDSALQGGGPSTWRTAWWLCTEIPSADSGQGGEFFKFMHILLSSNIKCFFFFIVTSACFDCQHFRSQITKARL